MRRESLIDNTDILLFDILQTQLAILSELRTLNTPKVILPSKDKTEQESTVVINKKYPCKHCGGEHDRSIDIVNCGKKKNKKG